MTKTVNSKRSVVYMPKVGSIASLTHFQGNMEAIKPLMVRYDSIRTVKLRKMDLKSIDTRKKMDKEASKRFRDMFFNLPVIQTNIRRKSYDVTTKEPRCQLKQFHTRTMKENENRRRKARAINAFPASRDSEYKKRPVLLNKAPKRVSRTLSEAFFTRLEEKKENKLPSLNKSREFMFQINEIETRHVQSMDEKLIGYLRRTLSSIVTESVYFKDYFKLFKRYQEKHKQAYRYRSKSESRFKPPGSACMQHIQDYCLFTDYLYNIYNHYNMVKAVKTKNSYKMNKNTILSTEIDRLKMNKVALLPQAVSKSFFNFFSLNKYLKEFSLAVKEFNQTGVLRYQKAPETNASKKIRRMKQMDADVDLCVDPPVVDQQMIQQPINNIKSVNLFKKLVQNTVVNEKQKARKQNKKKNLGICFNKAFFFIKNKFGKEDEEVQKKERSRSETSYHKKLVIELEKVYKLPKTVKFKQIADALTLDTTRATAKFRLKSLNVNNGSYSTRLKKTVVDKFF